MFFADFSYLWYSLFVFIILVHDAIIISDMYILLW